MRRRLKLLAALIGVPVLLLGAAALIVPKLVDSEHYKREVTALIAERTGHDLRIGGQVRLHVFPGLGLTVTDVRLANPPGYHAGNLARLPWMKVDLAVLPLLAGRVEPRAIRVTGLTVQLERDEDGRGNWETGTAPGEEGAGALTALAIGGLDIRDASVRWRGGADDQGLEVSNVTLRTGAVRGDRGIDDVHLQATFPESGLSVEARGDVRVGDGGRLLSVPKLEASFRVPDAGGMDLDGTVETGLAVDLATRQLTMKDARIDAGGRGSDGRRLEASARTDLGIDLAGGRLTRSALGLTVRRYALAGVAGELAAKGVISGDLLSGTFIFHGMQMHGTVALAARADSPTAFTLTGTLHGDLARRRLSAPGLAITGSFEDGRLPFVIEGDLELAGNARTLTLAHMDLDLAGWAVGGDLTVRSRGSPPGVQGVMDLRVADQPLAGSFAVLASEEGADAFDVRADAVVDLDVEDPSFTVHGRSALVARARVRRGDGEGLWRIGDLALGIRVADASLPDGELTLKLTADMDVDMRSESVGTDNLRMTVGDNPITGAARASGFAAPAIRVDLQADAIDADRLGLPIAIRDDAAGSTPMHAYLETIRGLDITGEVRVKRLTIEGVVMENVRLVSSDGTGGGSGGHAGGADTPESQ